VSGLVGCLTEALRQHTWWLAGNLGVPGMADSTTYKCDCGWSGDDPHAHVAGLVVEALWSDELLDAVDDAIETSLLSHASLDNDSRCSCGARNNMDGDVLDGHRFGVVSDAVRAALGVVTTNEH
jgi:hypothetical protein